MVLLDFKKVSTFIPITWLVPDSLQNFPVNPRGSESFEVGLSCGRLVSDGIIKEKKEIL